MQCNNKSWELIALELMEVLSPFALYSTALKDRNFFYVVSEVGNQKICAGSFHLAKDTLDNSLLKIEALKKAT